MPVICIVSEKNVTTLTCYKFDVWYVNKSILTIFGRNVTDKVGNEKMFYFSTSPD